MPHRPAALAPLLALFAAVALLGCATDPAPTSHTLTPPADTALAPRPTADEPLSVTLDADRAIDFVLLGHSVQNRPITMYRFGTAGPSLLIFGGIHGDEPTSETLARDLVHHLHQHPHLYADRRIAVLPAANPDGLLAGTRTNVNAVDCNRNFPTDNWHLHPSRPNRYGSAPASEPETRAILAAVELTQPVRIISIHSTGSFPKCNNYDGPATALAQAMAEHNGYPVEADLGYATPGSFGTWAGDERQIPTITLELDRDDSAQTAWKENREALIAFIEY
ncbi:MAG: M14 family murein peptide amidase A [Planctomycetota bacterium]